MTRTAAVWDEWVDEDFFSDPLGPVVPSGEGSPVTFPSTFLVSRVQIALGADLSADPLTWAWEDITRFVRVDQGISLTAGRRDEATQVSTGSGQIKLDNRDGRFSRRNPTGPYYGLLSKNTPIWATVDAGSGGKTRMEMFVNEWPTRWDQSGNDSTVTIQCAGILRRLAQGQVLKSPLRRAYLGKAAPTLVAYWPCEDENGSETAASGLSTPGTTPLSGVVPTFTTGISGSAGALDLVLTGVEFGANVALPSAAGFQIEFTARSDSASTMYVITLRCGDFLAFVQFDSSLADNASHHVAVRLEQSGADVLATSWRDGVFISTTTNAGFTLGTNVALSTYPIFASTGDPATGTFLLAHLAVYGFADMDAPTLRAPAADGYAGEMAHERMVRLCSEEGVLFDTAASTSPTLGPQGIEQFIALLREAESASLGVLHEKRWGLAFQSLAERYNAPVGLALDFDAGHIAEPPEPADDDQRTTNKVTVSRTGGSEYTAEIDSGPMGTGSEGPGIYDDAVTINVQTDDQLPQQAKWRLHVDTTDEDRWPAIALNLAHDPDLIDAWTSLGYGSRLTAANPPSQVAPDALDQIIEGHTESWDQFIWTASLNCSPASPYRVGVVASANGNIGRVDAANSTLAADATSGATTISVASTGALWRTGAVNFDIGVAGERMTVTNISGGSSPQTFTVTRSVNGVVKAQPASIAGRAVKVSLWAPAVVAL